MIVSTYAMHHLATADFDAVQSIDLLGLLTPFGRIYIGDIMFDDAARTRSAVGSATSIPGIRIRHYHVFDEILARAEDQLALSFLKTSFCGGVLIVEKFHELCAPECDMNLKVRR
ncbi:MAG: hypothetical protein MZU97_11235 [Bacillus subtilis]|nr:hypothetical protein [Bacillus subtilis]